LSCTTLRAGLKIALADILEDVLVETGKEVAAIVGDANVLVIPTDVSKIADVQRLREKVYEAWGEVSSLRYMAIRSFPT
jgi:enoyl-[acyl-carrier-protein] reductase (NADH)